MNSTQLSNQELDKIHYTFKAIIIKVINNGCKFEQICYIARRIIRADYNSIGTSMDDILNNTYEWARDCENNQIKLTIDPTTTTKKTYIAIINNIYATNLLKTQLKDTGALTKEKKLLLLLDINYLHTYYKLSQVKIINAIDKEYSLHDSKEINRYIKMAREIKNSSDHTD